MTHPSAASQKQPRGWLFHAEVCLPRGRVFFLSPSFSLTLTHRRTQVHVGARECTALHLASQWCKGRVPSSALRRQDSPLIPQH